MKKRGKRIFFIATALAAILLAGCGVGEPVVIREKPEGTASRQQEQSRENEGTDTPEAEEGVTVSEQVQAPERYQAEGKGEGMLLMADAPVTVPDVQAAAAGTSRCVNFTEDEYAAVKKALAEALDIEWKEESTETLQPVPQEGTEELLKLTGASTRAVGISASGDEYIVSYETAGAEIKFPTSLIWVTRKENYGRGMVRPAQLYETGATIEGQPAGKGIELEGKATKLLRDAGFEDYQMCRGRWRRSYYELKGEVWSEHDYYIVFTPVAEGITCAKSGVNLLGNSYTKGPYIEVFYSEDGTLNQLKIIGKGEIQAGAAAGNFLLPFEAVYQLFEQYCKDYFSSGGGKETTMPKSVAVEKITTADACVKVKSVKLEYVFVLPEDETADKLDLIPAWNFYGSIEQAPLAPTSGEDQQTVYWTARQEPEGLILSIRADDGQILAD